MEGNIKRYNTCITNLACSILKHFELSYSHKTIQEIDDILEKNKVKNVVVLLCDGLGSNILQRTLSEEKFLIKNRLKDINSVIPSTTTASTTSMLSGLDPIEHGWLGWDLYIKPVDKIITMFLNTIKDTDIQAANYNVATRHFPYETITERINSAGKFSSRILFPFGRDSYNDLDDMLRIIENECKDGGKKYIYAYYEEPDSTLHHFGVNSTESIDVITSINDKIERMSKNLNNTLLIVTADHGHINSTPITLSKIPDIYDLLAMDIWIEGRLCSFKVIDGKESEFKELFLKYFKKDFILKTKQEVIEENLFGYGQANELFKSSIGDFIAIGITDKYFRYCENSILLKSMHAGFTEDEMKIPIICVIKK